MAQPYRELFAAPGTRGFALAGLLARIPLPMIGIGIITMLSQLRGSYALAGAVSASFVLSYALVSPQVSRWVDRRGQSRVLPLATAISVLGMLLLLGATWWQAPDWILFAGAVLAGFMPSMSAMVRARWTAIYRGQDRLQTAYSLETVLDEVTFIAGPPLSVGLAVLVFPQAGVLAAALLLIAGVSALLLQKGTEPPIHVQEQGSRPSVLRLNSVRLLALLMVAMGVIVGTVDIVSVAFAQQMGQPGGGQPGAVGLRPGFLRSRSGVWWFEAEHPFASPASVGRFGYRRHDLAFIAGSQRGTAGRGGFAGWSVFRPHYDCGHVAGRACGAGAAINRGHDLAAGWSEYWCGYGGCRFGVDGGSGRSQLRLCGCALCRCPDRLACLVQLSKFARPCSSPLLRCLAFFL